jgi:triosephosphate isomerase (TIM)
MCAMIENNMQTKKSAKKYVIANWKMHGNLEQNLTLLEAYVAKLVGLKNTQVVVCIPYPYLAQAQSLLQHTDIAWGAQNLAKNEDGPFTGEVSAKMLRDFGCQYVILGHSERATAYCESDENIAQKFMMAKKHGITPILCVGETLIEREAGVMELKVGKQLDAIIDLYGIHVFEDTVISYEPIWAIGTGLAATPVQAQAMHKFISEKLSKANNGQKNSVKVLYGGSVNPQNALQLFLVKNIDGGLVGKCSLNPQEFEGICEAAEQSAS